MARSWARRVGLAAIGLLLMLCAPAQAKWWDEGWEYRRTIAVEWNADKAQGTELAQARVFTAGHHLEGGADVRVLTIDGRMVPHEVLFAGPGDRVDVVFALQKGVRAYCVYFGHPKPPDAPVEMRQVKPTGGLLMETRKWDRQLQTNYRGIREAFERSKPVLGRTVVERPFIGFNPITEEAPNISKTTGTLYAPQDGSYLFAISADDRGALFIDGKGVAFAHSSPGDTRFNGTVELKRGPHPVEIYHADYGGGWRISIGWQRPDMQKVDAIEKTAFGLSHAGKVGALEHVRKKLVADFAVEYLGECFIGNEYAHRYRLSAAETRGVEYEWDLGDGQKRKGPQVEHVYLRGGVYPVRLKGKSRENEDAQTTKLHVGREVQRLDSVPQDEPAAVSKLVAGYGLGAMSSPHLVRAVQLHREAGDADAMLKACAALAKLKQHAQPERVMAVLKEATQEPMRTGRAGAVLDLLRSAPADSNLQPAAAELAAEYLLWWQGIPEGALDVLRPFAEKHDRARAVYAQALVLAGQVGQGAPMLRAIETDGDPARAAAMSGAMARTVEYFLGEKDWEAGEEQWRQWQERYPEDFLNGYSLWLRVKLMEARGAKAAAAQVAEAFATAVPTSAYAPRLLHEASGLVGDHDPDKQAELQRLLKERYPEDPLSQK